MEREESIRAFEQFIERRSPGRRTALDYSSDVKLFAKQCAKAWREVTLHDIDGFVDHQRETGLSAATVKRRVAALKTFFNFLAEESGDLAWPNPVRSKRHAGKQPKKLPRDLNNETVMQVWSVIDEPRDQAWFALLLRGGLRVGELVGLKLNDILRAAQGNQAAQLRVEGKGRKERLVLLEADAYAVLAKWLQLRPQSELPYVFLNARGQQLTENGVEWLLHQYSAQVGVNVTPHQLRHTYARQLTEAGMPLATLSKLLGHAQISTTQIYTAGADPGLTQAYQAAMAQLQPPVGAPAPAAPPTGGGAWPAETAPFLALPPAPPPKTLDCTQWAVTLPAAIRTACLNHLRHCLPTWLPQRQFEHAKSMLGAWRIFFTWQLQHRPIAELAELTLADLQHYQQASTARHLAPATTNRRLDYVMALLRAQADRGAPINASVFRLRPLPRPDALPRALPDSHYLRLEAFVARRLGGPDPETALQNACFFVLAHTGLRAAELVDLQYRDLDLAGRRLFVRQGKGGRDRIVYLSSPAVHALASYLAGFRRLPTDPLWTRPDGTPITYDWLKNRLARLAKAAEVPHFTAHQLRHTLATRLLNAGMDIARIQRLLGHEYVVTTQIYARVADTVVEADYHAAIHKIMIFERPFSDSPLPVSDWPAPVDNLQQLPT